MNPDTVTFKWETADGDLIEADFTLEEAAAWKRGEPVAMYGGKRVRHLSLNDRIAAQVARLDQLYAERRSMERRYPGIADGEWT